jgi:hypothetical protein
VRLAKIKSKKAQKNERYSQKRKKGGIRVSKHEKVDENG